MGSGEILERLQRAVVRSVVYNHDLIGRRVGHQRHECLLQPVAATGVAITTETVGFFT
jgi:hypothetical protein